MTIWQISGLALVVLIPVIGYSFYQWIKSIEQEMQAQWEVMKSMSAEESKEMEEAKLEWLDWFENY